MSKMFNNHRVLKVKEKNTDYIYGNIHLNHLYKKRLINGDYKYVSVGGEIYTANIASPLSGAKILSPKQALKEQRLVSVSLVKVA